MSMLDPNNPWQEDVSDVSDVIDPMEVLDVHLAQAGCPYIGCNGTLPAITEGVETQFCEVCQNRCFPMPEEGLYVTDDEYTTLSEASRKT